MKLHLPIALLAAVLSSIAYAGEASVESKAFGAGQYYSYTDENDTIHSTFVGDCTGGSFGSIYKKGWVAGVPATDSNRYAANVDLTIGDGETKTRVNYAVTVGHGGYACDGDKSITVNTNAHVGYIYGAYNLNQGHKSGFGVAGEESYWDNGNYFAPKSTEDNVFSINIKGADVDRSQKGSTYVIYGAGSQASTRIPAELAAAQVALGSKEAAEAYAFERAPWALNEKLEINIDGGLVGVNSDKSIGSDFYDATTGEIKTSSIRGAGFSGFAVNNTVEINIGKGSEVYGSIYAGGSTSEYSFTDPNGDLGVAGKTYTFDVVGWVRDTAVNIEGDVYGHVYGGGSSGVVKENAVVTLSSGFVKGNVYASGMSGDTVTKDAIVVLKGAGTNVEGKIYGRADGAVVGGNRILSFDSYTGSVATVAEGDDDYVDVDWSKFENFNAIEVNNSKLNFGNGITADYESLKLNNAEVKADSLAEGNAIKLNMQFSELTVNGKVNMAEGSSLVGIVDWPYTYPDGTPFPDSPSVVTGTEISGTGIKAQCSVLNASNGGISLTNSTLEATDLNAKNGTVSLTNSSMIGGDIVAKSFKNDGSDATIGDLTVSANTLSTPSDSGVGKVALYNSGTLTIEGNLNNQSSANVYHTGEGSLTVVGDVSQSLSKIGQNGGKVEIGGNLKANHVFAMNGTLELSGNANKTAIIDGETHLDNQELLHSGEGNVRVDDVIAYNDVKIKQSGNGELTLGNITVGIPSYGIYSDTVIEQTGTGKIVLTGMAAASEGSSLVLNQSGGGSIVAESSTVFNKVVSSGNGGTIYNMDNNMTVNEVTGNGNFYQKGTGTLTFTGNAEMDILAHAAGIVDFSGDENTTADIDFINVKGAGHLVQSGDGTINVGVIINYSQETYTMTQSGNGILNILGAPASPDPVIVNQTGTGEIKFHAGVNLSKLNMTGGGSVANLGGSNINTILVFNGSTLENSGNLTSKNVSISQSTVNNSGTMKVDNFAIADGEDATSSITNSGKGNMALGEVDCTVANATFKQEGTGTMTFGGNVTNRDFGAFDASLNLSQSAGKVEFAGKEGTTATFNQVQASGGELVHSGKGTVNVESGMVSGDYSIKQTGNGTMNIGDGETPGGIVQFGGTTTITQEGTGTIANYGASGAYYGEFNLTQTGGGTVENWGNLTLNDVSVTNDSTLLNAGELWILDELAIENATLAFVVNDVMGDTGAALTLGSSASITALDNVAFHVIFDNEEVYAQKGVNYGLVEFSVTVMEGLTNLTDAESLAEIDSLVAAMDAGSLTLSTLDENGNEVAMKVNSAGLTVAEDGSVVLSGTMIIPEPTTATLSLLALAALAARRRRK